MVCTARVVACWCRGSPSDLQCDAALEGGARGETLSCQTLSEIFGQQAADSSGKSHGATWCRLALAVAVDAKSLRQLETIQDQLSTCMSADDLVKLQDGALNWRPLEEEFDEECAVGIERV